MAKLVVCRACKRRVSEEAVKELKGELFCPACYGPLLAKLKEQKDRKKQAETAGANVPAPGVAPAAPAARPAPAATAGTTKLAAKAAGVVGARQLGTGKSLQTGNPNLPDLPDLPDLPPGMIGSRAEPGGGAGGLGPDALGKGIYLAAGGMLLFVGYLLAAGGMGGKPSWGSLACLALAAIVGFFAFVAGIFNLVRGGEIRRQVCGGLALAAGAFLAGWGGVRCTSDAKAFANSDPIFGKDQEGQPGESADSKTGPETKPEAKPAAKPETKPEPKPATGTQKEPGHGLDLVATQPKPDPEPEPKPEPPKEPTREEKLRAEIRGLLPGAAAVEAGALGLPGTLKKLDDLDSRPLTAVVLLSGELPALKPELERTSGGANKKPAELAESVRVGEHLSVLRDEFIAEVSILLLDGGERVSGEVKVKAPFFHAAFPFEARRRGDQWRVESFTLRNSARKVTLDNDKWKVVEAETNDPVVRFARASSAVDMTGAPAALSGVTPDAKALVLYGELRASGKPAVPISDGARGVVLAAAGSTRAADVLAEVRDGDAWRPLALLVSGGRGPFMAVPEITTEVRGSKERMVTLSLIKKPGADGAFEVVTDSGARFSADAAGLGQLQGKLTPQGGRINLPVRIAVDGDAPLSAFAALLDACIRARVQPALMTVDPNPPAAPAEKNGKK